jgi:hypothetical protein
MAVAAAWQRGRQHGGSTLAAREGLRTAMEAAVVEYEGINAYRGGVGRKSAMVWACEFWARCELCLVCLDLFREAVMPLIDSSLHFCHGVGCTGGWNC